MASAQANSDLSKLSEGMSLSDMDVCFCLQQSSSVSALEGSSNTIHFPKDILVEFSNLSSSTLNPDWLPTSPIVVSPLLAPVQSPLVSHAHTLGLPLTLSGKPTAPALRNVLPVLASSPNLSGLDLSGNSAPWEVSQIKPVSDGPKTQLDVTELEMIWSPRRNQSVLSPTCPAATQSDGQRSWKDTLPVGSGEEGTQCLD